MGQTPLCGGRTAVWFGAIARKSRCWFKSCLFPLTSQSFLAFFSEMMNTVVCLTLKPNLALKPLLGSLDCAAVLNDEHEVAPLLQM